MPLPKNNRIQGEPNDKWADIEDGGVPIGRALAFSDVTMTFIWIGEIGNENSAAPGLNQNQAAFWSEVADQPDAAFA